MVHTVFCSACDRNVVVVPHTNDGTWRIVMSPTTSGEVACLEKGVRCTGALCPFCAVSPGRRDREEASRAGGVPTA